MSEHSEQLCSYAVEEQQQQQDDVQPPLLLDLSALLHHPCMLSDTESICRLLCTSKAVASAVAIHLAGQLRLLHAATHPQLTECLELWLYRNSGLVRSLDITCTCSELHQLLQLANLLEEHSATVSSLHLSCVLKRDPVIAHQLAELIAQHGRKLAGLSLDFKAWADEALYGGGGTGSVEAAEALLAEALQQAVAAAQEHAQGLQLRSFSSSTRSGEPLLQQLPAESLSSLQLLDLFIADEAADLQHVAHALQRLTGLQFLRIATYFGALDCCLPALSSHTCLTNLQLNSIQQLPLPQCLPASLQQLTLNYIPLEDEDEALEVSFDMSYLSELRSLDLQAEYHDFTLAADCQLPHSLTALTIPNVGFCHEGGGELSGSSSSSSACLLLRLQQLQQLSLEECSLTADALVQMSRALTALTQVQLAYTATASCAYRLGSDELVETAAAWALLPLVSLSFGLQCGASTSSSDSAEEDVANKLRDMSLTARDDASATSGLLLEQLGQLTGLASLRIYAFGNAVDASDGPAAAVPSMSHVQQPVYEASMLAACVQKLPGLQSLHIAGQLVGSQHAIAQLQQAVQSLSSCGLPKLAVAASDTTASGDAK